MYPSLLPQTSRTIADLAEGGSEAPVKIPGQMVDELEKLWKRLEKHKGVMRIPDGPHYAFIIKFY